MDAAPKSDHNVVRNAAWGDAGSGYPALRRRAPDPSSHARAREQRARRHEVPQAIDLYIADMRGEGRINSPNTERGYRDTLTAHARDVDERDPATRCARTSSGRLRLAGREHAAEEPIDPRVVLRLGDAELDPGRRDDPARQTRAPRATKPEVYRMTREEVIAFPTAARTRRERRVAYLGICAGARNRTGGLIESPGGATVLAVIERRAAAAVARHGPRLEGGGSA